MRPGFIVKGYRESLRQTHESVYEQTKKSALRGRLLAFPLGFVLLVTIPVVKLLSFLEALLFAAANLFTPIFPKYCSFYDGWISLKYAAFFFVGLIVSPLTALFACSALITSMLVDPLSASKKFAETCH